MKKLYTLIIAVIFTASTFAQAPDKMSYQAVVRDASNALVTSQTVGMQISILQGSATGTLVYVETHTTTTNINGLVSIEIGSGNIVSGNFSTIDWGNGPYFIKNETDPTGGTTYTITGTSQLVSVPYALYANTAGSLYGGLLGLAPGTAPGNTIYWDGTDWITNSSNIFNNGGNVGIHTTTPSENLVVSETSGATAGTDNFLLIETEINPFVHSTQGVLMQKDDGQKRGFRLFQDGSDDFNTLFKIASFSAGADIDRLVIKRDNGNVGLGTTTPSENLVVSETSGATAGTDNFLLIETEINPFVHSTQGVLMQKDDGQKRGFRLFQDGSDDANTLFKIASFSASADIDRLVIKRDNGNVGLGTTTPTENLVVSETSGATAGTDNFLLVETVINPFVHSTQGVLMQKDDGQKRGFRLFQDGSNDSNTVFKIASFSASTDIDRLSIKRDSGNVGIGTNTPTSKLQVVGLPVFSDNTAALGGGLTAGAFYRTSTGVLMVVF